MIKRFFTFTLAILLIFINLPVETFANTTLTITLKVGYVENYGIIKTPTFPGYNGFGYEYLHKILEYTDNNYNLEFVQVDWSEGLQMLNEGKLDLLAPAHYDPAREGNFIYSRNEFAIDTSFLASTDLDNTTAYSPHSLDGSTIGIQKDNIVLQDLKKFLADNNINANIIETTIKDYTTEMQEQNYDYFLVTSLNMIPDMNLTFNLGTAPTYLITRKDNADLMEEFDLAMERLNDKEFLFKELLYLKYFDHDLSTEDYISKDEFNLIRSHGTYKVGIVNLYEIFSYTNNPEIISTSHDVMTEIAKISDIKVNYVELPPNFSHEDTLDLDFYFIPIGYSADEDNTDIKSIPYISSPFLVAERLDSYKAKDNTIGILSNYKFTNEFIDFFLPNQTIIEFDNIRALYTAFANGGVDNLFITNSYYNLIYRQILDVDHTVTYTNYYENASIHFNADFEQEKIDIFNKLITYVSDDFLQTSSLKNIAALSNREKVTYYQTYTRVFIVLICIASFIVSQTKKQKDKSFAELSTHDELTGLLTISKFISETTTLLEENPDENYTLLSLDIDNFKYINEIYSYEVGSNILTQISYSIKNHLDITLPASRVSADNFLIIAKTDEILPKMEVFLQPDNNIMQEIHEHIDEHYIINFSIGGYKIIDKSLEISYMIDCCNLARSFSKMELGNTFNLFSEDMKAQEKVKNDIIAHMNQALADREFVLYYQPKFDIVSMKVTGAEALVRWFSEGKMVPPNNFIPLFEENGFIENLDYYVVERACEFIAVHNTMKLPVISVNLSGITIMKKDVVDKVMAIVRQHKVKPKQLDLEITESAFVDHFETALESIDQFRDLGFTISMDDFGAGISSLNRLKEISIDILKIDREFIVGSLENEKGSKIIRNIVNMAKDLKLETVAEGIETDEQLEFLRNLGCDIGQGYYYSRPLPEKDFVELLQKEE